MNEPDVESQIIDDIADYIDDPLGFVKYAYEWGEGDLHNSVGPRSWQAEAFEAIGEHLRNPKTRFEPLLFSRASGHGIGKSAFIGMLIQWGLSTCDDCRVTVTANTDRQLRTKTVPEVIKWNKRAINGHWFKTTATSIYSNEPKHEKSWRADFIPWSKNNTEAFAGLHNEGKRIILVFDEGSAIDDAVWDVAEGALTDQNTEIIWLVFGNPTRNTGRFRECFRKYKHRWNHGQIDSRTVEGVNLEQIKKWESDFGEDSDWFKVRVRGMFPSSSIKQFISTEDVDKAYHRTLEPKQYEWAPKILTVDPAWTGDDELVIGLRQGLHFEVLETMEKNDNDILVANKVANLEDDHGAEAVFIDGGYGTGIVSAGRTMNRKWVIVWFGEKSNDEGCVNKRAEMWNAMKKWMQEGGSIPKDMDLYNDLIGPETVPRMDGKIQLESKEHMKSRGLKSPDRADALALSFAHPVRQKKKVEKKRRLYSPGTQGTGWMS